MATKPTAPTPTAAPLSEDSQLAVVQYVTSAITSFLTTYNVRGQLESRDRAYYREKDQTTAQLRAKQANDSGDSSKVQNVTVPVVMPQTETALAYLQEVFLSGYPIFGTVAPPELQDAMTQMDTLIGENSIRAGWPLELLQTMRNGLKYDLGAVEVVWENRKTFSIINSSEANITQGDAKETYYAGNFLKNVNPYNLILDPRVSPDINHLQGEFAGYSEIVSRIEAKRRMGDLDVLKTMNFRKAFETASNLGPGSLRDTTAAVYMPDINPNALIPPSSQMTHDWLQWAGLVGADKGGIQYQNSYEWTVMYARILPADFGIGGPNRNHVQIWKFIILNRQVVIFAERQTNAHNYLPIVVCKPSADSMGYQSKSFSENVTPYQDTASALMNSGLESQRRKVYDRMFYDPTRVNKADMDKVSSVARIPIKNAGYGKNISDAIYQVPYRDDGVAEIVNLSQTITQMADVANGTNRVSQGQFQKGNKTRQEFDTTMSGANSRDRMRALGLEFSFYVPIKEIIKSNVLQYQPPTSLVNSDSQATVTIDPATLRKANLAFKLSDGYAPSDKLMAGDTIGMLFQGAQALPEIRAEYDLMGMFVYSMKLKGANWLGSFKYTDEQKQQKLAMMQQASTASGPPQAPTAAPQTPQQ